MYQKKSRIHSLMILGLDCICIAVSLTFSNYIRNGSLFDSDNARMNFGMLLGACLTVYLAIKLLGNEEDNIFQRRGLKELLYIVQSNVMMLSGTAIILYFFRLLDAYSRLMFLFFILINCSLMFLIHQFWKEILPFILKWFGETRKLLVITEREYANALMQELKEVRDFSFELTGIGFVDEKGTSIFQECKGFKVVADKDSLIEYCKGVPLDEVIIAVSEGKKKEIFREMEILAEMGITIHFQIPIPELTGARQKELSKFGSLYMVTYANRMIPLGQVLLKRLFDLCGGIIGGVLLLLLTVILGPLIKIESRGPVFFIQDRVGRNGRVFKMYKFRSMYADAEERKKELMAHNEMHGYIFKMENDPRITKVGKFLRKTSLDEFPQFVNVLKGDMSLVGTRPPTLDEFKQYSPYHKKRLSFRPGLTGMWQVSGRNDITDFEEIVKLDVKYIDNWSLMLDIKILFKTVLAVFSANGAR